MLYLGVIEIEKEIDMTEQTNEPRTFKVPEYNLKWFETKFRALIKKAEKCKAETPAYEILGNELVTYNKGKPNEKSVMFTNIQVSGFRPSINGWEFVARIEHTDAGNLVKARPDFEGEDFTAYHEGKSHCEHCNTTRTRKHTYIVQSEEGKRLRVGSSCLVDFLGHASPEYYARIAELECEVHEMFTGGGFHEMRQEDYMPLSMFLETALNVVKLHEGYRTASVHGSDATSHRTSYFFFGRNPLDKEKTWEKFVETINELRNSDEDFNKIQEVIKYHQEMDAKGDFQHNMQVIAKLENVTYKDFGIACYMIQNYFNFEKKKAEWQLKKEADALKKNEWIGEVREKKKDRRDFEVTYIGSASFENQFGTTYFHRFEDNDGRMVVAKVTKGINCLVQEFNGQSERVQMGDKITVKGSITRHDEYKERKQTVINRVKVMGYTAVETA